MRNKRRMGRLLLPLLGITIASAGSLLTASLAWYQVTAPSITVAGSSSVLISTASPDYGEFKLTNLHIVEPNLGEVDLTYPNKPKDKVELTPVSTVNGLEYYTVYGGKKMLWKSGYYRFVAKVTYDKMVRGMSLNFHIDASVPKCGGVDKPYWLRSVLFISQNYDFDHQTPSNKWGSYILHREDSNSLKGIGQYTGISGGNIMNVSPQKYGATWLAKCFKSNSPNCSKDGVFYIEMTTYIEGLKHDVTDGALDEEISLSVFCFPSPNPV